jgi:hypothetical protein
MICIEKKSRMKQIQPTWPRFELDKKAAGELYGLVGGASNADLANDLRSDSDAKDEV